MIKKNNLTKWILLLLSVAVITNLFGCAPAKDGDSASTGPGANSTAGDASGGKKLRIGMVFDSGGRGDKSFNDSAYTGLQKAEQELGVEIKTIETPSASDYEGNIAILTEEGFDLVIAVGITQANAMDAVAEKNPNARFAIVDAPTKHSNVRSLLFAEEQGSYLAGFAAALASKTGKVGFVGGMKIDLILKFEAGYRAGALAANPKIVVLPGKYTESWDDSGAGKSLAKSLFNEGADVVYHAAGRCGVGVINAAQEMNKLAIGVDSDQDDLAKGFVLTSMIKRVDEAVFQSIKDLKEGKFTGEAKSYDLKSNGVMLSDFRNTKDRIGADGLKRIDEARTAIIDGKVVVPTKL